MALTCGRYSREDLAELPGLASKRAGVPLMIFVRRLSESERRDLQLRARTEAGRVSERIHMVLLSDRRYTVARIAGIFECSEVTVRRWIKRFDANGIAGLHDHPRPGRPERGGRRHDLPRE